MIKSFYFHRIYKSSTMAQTIMFIIPFLGIIGLIFTYIKSQWIARQDPGNAKMQAISRSIAEGAMAFLKAEYKVLIWFVIVVGLLMAFGGTRGVSSSWLAGVSFMFGAFCSILAGYIGMKVATKANVRTTAAARTSMTKALEVAFAGGSVMGMGVVGLGVLGLGSLFLIYNNLGWDINKVITVITGFSFGASSIALFARVGGGIYTKAADVGADLVGKIEAGM
jgi:K(+)-stimulated pyrophosphate-energized sodium pump